MGTGDLSAALERFRRAGTTLFSLGLVRDAEGNLSTWDGARLRITRTGARLAGLEPTDLLEGSLDEPPADASSDLDLHLARYRAHGPGAFAHAHPPGTVPERGDGERGPHGRYAFAPTLDEAVGVIVAEARGQAAP